jgi:hypothetical protein
MRHPCEYDLHSCSSSDCEVYEPCGKEASGKYRSCWYCLEHLDEMMDANRATDAQIV